MPMKEYPSILIRYRRDGQKYALTHYVAVGSFDTMCGKSIEDWGETWKLDPNESGKKCGCSKCTKAFERAIKKPVL